MRERTAIVVGAAGGIGSACTEQLLEDRRCAVLVDALGEPLHSLAADARAKGRRIATVVGDAGAPDFGDRVSQAAGELEPVDAVVWAVAHEELIPAIDISRQSLQRSFDVGPLGAFEVFRALVVDGRLSEGCALTVIGSLHADMPFGGVLGYNLAQAALAQLVKTLANEWAPLSVRVNAVAPGWTHTPGEQARYGPDELLRAGAALPFGRMGRPADIAAGVGFISSPEACYISGATLTIDGALGPSLARLP